MRIAYLILAHRQPQHVGALIDQLDDGNARFFVHIDAKSDIEPFRTAIGPERAMLLEERLPIRWGTWNMVQATLNLLRRAHQDGASTYYQLLSDSCFPIKSNREIAAKLGNGNLNYITINERIKPGSRHHGRLLYRWPDPQVLKFLKQRHSLQRLKVPIYAKRLIKFMRRQQDRLTRRQLPPGVKPYKGWQWWCLTHECTRYVLNYTDANPELVRFFRATHIPDESFFHTIIMNSEFGETLSPGLATGAITGNHYVRWDRGNGVGKPCVLKETDFETLVASEACFARKLDETQSGRLIKLLRERVNGAARSREIREE
jgi:hypothetical protein